MADTSEKFVYILILCLILSFFVIRPFFAAVLSGLVLALIFHPLFNFINKKIKNKSTVSVIVTIVAILVIFVPVLFLIQQLGYQARVAYVVTKQRIMTGNIVGSLCENNSGLACQLNSMYQELWSDPSFTYFRDYVLDLLENTLWNRIPSLVTAIPKLLLELFIMVLVLFYSLRDGKSLLRKLKHIIPLKVKHKNELFKKLNDVTYAVVYGQVITGLVQGLVGIIGMYIFGIQSPLIIGLALTVASLIPFVGSPFVWAPVSILKALEGVGTNSPKTTGLGIGLFLYGFFVISTIDNIIKPKLVGDRSKVNPAIILLGMFGGVALLGIPGLVLGPLILAFTLTLIEIYLEEKNETES